MVDFSDLLDGDEEAVIDPRDIFLTLARDKRFSFPRDIQTEVMKSWFEARDQRDTVIKLNVGSGKTVVGLLLLQSSLNEGKGPALYVSPDIQLTNQVIDEAEALGIDVTDEPRDPAYASGQKICVINIYKLFNGKSVFGVGNSKLTIGTVVVDDAHACVATISNQFRITLPSAHEGYGAILETVGTDLKQQSPSRYKDLVAGDPREAMEVPFWAWTKHQDTILTALHSVKETRDLEFNYPLLREVLPYCRCIIGAQSLEIEPLCPPTELIRSFHKATRRIYMTATLADDSVLVTHFGAAPEKLGAPIVPKSSQSMGERMVLMPQTLNPDISIAEIRDLLVSLSSRANVVVIVPSTEAAALWENDADQVLMGDDVVSGVERLRTGHVGLSVLVNRYDGIDLPGDACRVLAIVGLPEVASHREAADMAVLADSTVGLRRQMQRIEQGMGRGVRSNDDYCVVLLCGAKLTSRIRSPEGKRMLTAATQAQLELSTSLAKKLHGEDMAGIAAVIGQCLDRDEAWVKVSKRALVKAQPQMGLSLDPAALAMRRAFDLTQVGDYPGALEALESVKADLADDDAKALLLARQAEIAHHFDPARAQKILLSAHKLNRAVLKPLAGIAYQKLAPVAQQQAAAVQDFHRQRFLEAADRVLHVKALTEDLVFKPNTASRFESAIHDLALLIGLDAQRPEREYGHGPDILWAFAGGDYLIIECKNGATSQQGISKVDLGQLGQAIAWFESKYTKATAKRALMIHPLHKLGPGAAIIDGVRVMTEVQLARLRGAITDFAQGLGDADVLNSTNRIADLLLAHHLASAAFVNTYTTTLKS